MSKVDQIMAKDPDPARRGGRTPDGRDGDPGPGKPVPRRSGTGRGREGDWLNGQLRRLYDDVLSEPVPDDLLALVERLDDAGHAHGDTPRSGERGAADGSMSDPAGDSDDDRPQTRETSRS